MLTGKLVRVRYARNRIIPVWLDTARPQWLDAAEQLLLIFRNHAGRTRGELDAEVDDAFGDAPGQLITAAWPSSRRTAALLW